MIRASSPLALAAGGLALFQDGRSLLMMLDSPLLIPSTDPETAQRRMFRLMQIRNEYAEQGADAWTMDSFNWYVEMSVRWVKRLEREKHSML